MQYNRAVVLRSVGQCRAPNVSEIARLNTNSVSSLTRNQAAAQPDVFLRATRGLAPGDQLGPGWFLL
jgi:hypothetical protein